MANADFRVHPEEPPRLDTIQGVRIREDSVFTNDRGQEKKGIRKRAEGIFAKLGEEIRRVLSPDEAVLFVTRCQAPVSSLEQMTLGWYIYYATGTVLVLTNRRLIQFFVKSNGQWKKMLRDLFWGDIEQAKVKGKLSRTPELKFRIAKKETYWKVCGEAVSSKVY